MLLLCALVAGSGSVWAAPVFEKITSTSGLVAGDKYIIVCTGQATAMGNVVENSSKPYHSHASVTISEGKITWPGSSVVILTLGGETDAWTLTSTLTNNYLYLQSNDNYLGEKSTNTDNTTKWKISFSDGDATIQNVEYPLKKSATRRIEYNKSSGSERFACYASTQQAVQLYRLTKETVTFSTSAFASVVSTCNLDFSSPITNLEAPFKATAAVSGTGVTLTSMSGIVAANTPMIIKGTQGQTANIPVTTSAASADASGNLLSGSATDAQPIAANEAYILKGGRFCLVTANSSVPAGKAYLLASKVDGAANELTFVIDEENSGTTGIEKTLVNKATDGQIYNLAGQRVAQPTKGLYIVNGKKIVIK